VTNNGVGQMYCLTAGCLADRSVGYSDEKKAAVDLAACLVLESAAWLAAMPSCCCNNAAASLLLLQ